MNKFAIAFVFSLFPVTSLWCQTKISVEDFTIRDTFAEKEVTGINWMNDGKFYSALTDNKVVKYDVTTGQSVQTLVDGAAFSTPIDIDEYNFSADERKILLQTKRQAIYRRSFVADYFIYDMDTQRLRALSSNGKQSYATFSPDGTMVAFVRNNNLFYVMLSDMREQQITDDGKFNEIINGTTDWVYEEELSFVVAFEWSPDGKKLAYYRFDESDVKEYNLQYWTGLLYPYDYRYKYPKAGEKNSTVEIWIHDLSTGKKVRAETGLETDIYIPRIKWTMDPNVLSIRKLNRLQNHTHLLHINAATGAGRVILEEKTDTYFDIEVLDDLTYLRDGKQFIYTSESNGFKHIYLYSIDGRLIRQLTSGNYEVSDFIGFDEKSKTCYYTSTEISPLDRHFYSVSFDGKKKVKLSAEEGTHEINMSTDFQFYIDHHSSAAHPSVVTLYRTRKNRPLKILETNEQLVKTSKSFGIAPKEFFTFKNDGGIVLNGYLLKPGNFDPSREYPVMVFQYSGPASQEAENVWAGKHFFFHQMLAQRGYIVAVIDPRGTGGRGEEFKKVTYRQLGKYELEDHLAGARYLGSLDFIDENRMGIWGWSYGGYMSSLAMTKGAGVFKLGIAVSPVTNWRFYDTIYTERYLQTPQLNPDGYDMNSPLTYAAKLEGKFLLIHGTGDDNVHFQNSIVFEDALINAGKQFQSFYYPDKQHDIQGPTTQHHLYAMMFDFIEKNL
ncbi:MAG TPA: DPP IV N-terminal domain-containing protein [Chryseosolibacter sp.]|nr:DPP IV N-terminal domain-containing protein [Chryseosolibacter sp.]